MSPRKFRTKNKAPTEETPDNAELAEVLPAPEESAEVLPATEESAEVEEDLARAIPQWVDVDEPNPVDEQEYLTMQGTEVDTAFSHSSGEPPLGSQLSIDSTAGAGSVASQQSDESSKEVVATLTKPTYPPSVSGEIWC